MGPTDKAMCDFLWAAIATVPASMEQCKGILLDAFSDRTPLQRLLAFHIGPYTTTFDIDEDAASDTDGGTIQVTRRSVGKKFGFVRPFLTPVLGEGKPAAKVVAQIETADGAIYVVDQVLGEKYDISRYESELIAATTSAYPALLAHLIDLQG